MCPKDDLHEATTRVMQTLRRRSVQVGLPCCMDECSTVVDCPSAVVI
jgi:hypothetical protein